MQDRPFLRVIQKFAYNSGLPQVAIVVVFLRLTAHTAPLNGFMHLLMVVTLLVVAISWPFPTAGLWTHYSLSAMIDVSSMSHFPFLRDGSVRTLDLKAMQGLISIPSLHTALAVLCMFAMRGTKLIPVFALLNILMILATPFEGGHYRLDVLASAILPMALFAFRRSRQ